MKFKHVLFKINNNEIVIIKLTYDLASYYIFMFVTYVFYTWWTRDHFSVINRAFYRYITTHPPLIQPIRFNHITQFTQTSRQIRHNHKTYHLPIQNRPESDAEIAQKTPGH